MSTYYRVVSRTELAEATDELLVVNGNEYRNPCVELLHGLGYWPMDPGMQPEPKPEEGYKVVDDGWSYVDDGAGGRFVTRNWRILKVVDPGYPPLGPDQEVVIDRWEDRGTEWVHIVVVYDVIDEKPEIDEKTRHLKEKTWEIDDENRRKIAHYDIVPIVDDPPELDEGEEVVEERWEYVFLEEQEVYFHVYRVMKVIREEPVIEPGQQIVEEWYEDDESTNTRTWFYKVRYVVDEPRPEVDEYMYRVIDLGIVDDEEKMTRGRKWLVKPIVRDKPEDDPDGNYRWVEDGEEETPEAIVIKYRQVWKVWRTIDKGKLLFNIFEMGKIGLFQNFLDNWEYEFTPEGGETQRMKVREAWQAAAVIHEDHPRVKEMVYHFRKHLLILDDDAAYEELLDRSVAE